MVALVIDCPHCRTVNSGVTIVNVVQNPRETAKWSVFGICSACNSPVAVVVSSGGGSNPGNYNGNILHHNSPFRLVEIYPRAPALEIPANIPDPVAKAYSQAEYSRMNGQYDAAAAMYRTAMERGLKDLSPGIAAWQLQKRIDQMAAQGMITAELKDWAHELRLDGNNAVHEEEATKETIEQMHQLCKFLLMYLYTLPEQVKAARARRAAP